MKIFVDNDQVFELNETKKKVIKNDIHDTIFDSDMKRRVRWILEHKYENCFKRLKQEWEPKLSAKGMQFLPLDPDAFAELVFSQSDYKDRAQRDKEEEEVKKGKTA